MCTTNLARLASEVVGVGGDRLIGGVFRFLNQLSIFPACVAPILHTIAIAIRPETIGIGNVSIVRITFLSPIDLLDLGFHFYIMSLNLPMRYSLLSLFCIS